MASLDPEIEAASDTCDDILDHLARITDAGDVDTAWALHCACMARYGFEGVIYSYAALPGHVDVLEDTLILSNHPRSFMEPYLREGWWRRPLYLRYAERTGQDSMPWRLLPDMHLTDAQRRRQAFRAAHGLTAGMSISFRKFTPQGQAGMGLCARPGIDQDGVDAIWRVHGQRLLLMSMVFHLRITTLPMLLAARSLSPRQAEVLYWSSDGKSVQDIATLLGLRPATVEKHLRLARAALGVQTTAQAVLRASVLNLLVRPVRDERTD